LSRMNTTHFNSLPHSVLAPSSIAAKPGDK
jgi:hypothetical protein